jgi:hypothetical protein
VAPEPLNFPTLQFCSGKGMIPFLAPEGKWGLKNPELPTSRGRTITDKSYVMHGILSGIHVPTGIHYARSARTSPFTHSLVSSTMHRTNQTPKNYKMKMQIFHYVPHPLRSDLHPGPDAGNVAVQDLTPGPRSVHDFFSFAAIVRDGGHFSFSEQTVSYSCMIFANSATN